MGLLLNPSDEDEIIPIGAEDCMRLEDDGQGATSLVDESGIAYFTSFRYNLRDGTATYHNMKKLLLRLSVVGLTGLTSEQLAGVVLDHDASLAKPSSKPASSGPVVVAAPKLKIYTQIHIHIYTCNHSIVALIAQWLERALRRRRS